MGLELATAIDLSIAYIFGRHLTLQGMVFLEYQPSNSIRRESGVTELDRMIVIFSNILKVYLEYLIICFRSVTETRVSLNSFYSLTACCSSQKTSLATLGILETKVELFSPYSYYFISYSSSLLNFNGCTRQQRNITRNDIQIASVHFEFHQQGYHV